MTRKPGKKVPGRSYIDSSMTGELIAKIFIGANMIRWHWSCRERKRSGEGGVHGLTFVNFEGDSNDPMLPANKRDIELSRASRSVG
jgi:hypothetical protein